MSEESKQKANKLVEKISPLIYHFNRGKEEGFAIKAAIMCCDEVMSAVVLHGAKWHEYNEIKKELLKM